MNVKVKAFLVDLINRFKYDQVSAMGAQITYYLILSFFPFVIILMTLLSFTPLNHERTIDNLKTLMPADAHRLVLGIIEESVAADRTTLISFSTITATWTASTGVSALIRGINKAYDQEETRPFWKVKLISIIFTLAMATIIIFSFLLLVLGEVLSRYLFNLLGFPGAFRTVWTLFRYLIPLLALSIAFLSIYYFIPNKRLGFKEVLPGAGFSVLGWISLSLVFSFYVNNFSKYSYTYGSIGGIFILLLWLYWNTLLILIGAEINATILFKRYLKNNTPIK